MNQALMSPHYAIEDFGTLSSLSSENLERVREAIRPFDLPVGAVLHANLEQGWLIFLVDGQLAIANEDGERFENIKAGSDRAMEPVFPEGCSDRQVSSSRSVSLIRIDRLHVEVLLSRQLSESTKVAEVSYEQSDTDVFASILAAHESEQLEVPSLPEVANAVNEAVRDSEMDFNGLAAVIQRDPPFTARLIQIANSAEYRGTTEVGTLSGAISRLGLDGTRNIVMAIAVEQLTNGVHPAAVQSFRNFYHEAVEIAALCYVVAHKTGSRREERAYMAGLLHSLGMVPIINHACELMAPEPDIAKIERVGVRLVGPVSSWLLSEWGLDAELCDTAEFSSDWYRSVDGNFGLVETVIAARLLRFVALGKVAPVDINCTNVGKHLISVGVDLSDPVDFLNRNKEQIESARQLLG